MPERIRLSRAKGWRKPEGAVVVSRPSKWGNPWRVGDVVPLYVSGPSRKQCLAGYVTLTAEMAVAAYRDMLREFTDPDFYSTNPPYSRFVESWREFHLEPLRGCDLACWCPLTAPCHADVLLELANGP